MQPYHVCGGIEWNPYFYDGGLHYRKVYPVIPDEWKCAYCGTEHDHELLKCATCGAWREDNILTRYATKCEHCGGLIRLNSYKCPSCGATKANPVWL